MDDSNTIWIEKYRPVKLDEIVGQDEIIERLSSSREGREPPPPFFLPEMQVSVKPLPQ